MYPVNIAARSRASGIYSYISSSHILNILRPFPYLENPVCLLKVSGLLHFTKAGCQGLGQEQGALLKRSELVTAKIYLINSVEMNEYTFRGSSSLFFFFFFFSPFR